MHRPPLSLPFPLHCAEALDFIFERPSTFFGALRGKSVQIDRSMAKQSKHRREDMANDCIQTYTQKDDLHWRMDAHLQLHTRAANTWLWRVPRIAASLQKWADTSWGNLTIAPDTLFASTS